MLPIRTERLPMNNAPWMMRDAFSTSNLEKDVILALPPIFGGTTPSTESPPATTTGTGTGQETAHPAGQSGTDTSAGGDSGTDPAEQLANDPNAIKSLLQQIDQLQKNLGKVTGERDQHLQKQQETERAQMNKEQQQEQDIANLQNQVEQQHRVIETMALRNAFLEQSDFQWNSVRQAMSELSAENYTVDIDLENGNAVVSGIDNEAKRIAKDFPWLLKGKAATESNNGHGGARVRGSGTPPSPPTGDAAKVAKRADLIKKFPVIAQGR